MTETSESRIYGLVEEIRADIDFELEDVITAIVRDLPEVYFQLIKRSDQLVHLKALLALSFCKLQEELMFRSSDGVHIAVIARQNFSGQLASILKRLPSDRPLTGAKIFTSKNHDFIIDLFEFETDTQGSQDSDQQANPSPTVESAIEHVATIADAAAEEIREFVSHYWPSSQILDHPEDLAEHFMAARKLAQQGAPAVRLKEYPDTSQLSLTVASSRLRARPLAQLVAEFLGRNKIDIEKAFLNDLHFDNDIHTAVTSFIASDQTSETFEKLLQELTELLNANFG